MGQDLLNACSGAQTSKPTSSYMKEFGDSTAAINNIVVAAPSAPIKQNSLASIDPLNTWRDDIVGHIADDYNTITRHALVSKDQSDSSDLIGIQLSATQSARDALQDKITKATAYAQQTKQEYRFQAEKQKAIFDLLAVFGITIGVYVVLASNPNVHIIALLVLLAGLMYVILYHAYRLKLPGTSMMTVISGILFNADFAKTLATTQSSELPGTLPPSSLGSPTTPPGAPVTPGANPPPSLKTTATPAASK